MELTVEKLLEENPELPWLEVERGWLPLISELIKELKPYLHKDPTFKIEQIKQKFGGLRVYYTARQENWDEISKIIDKYESISAKTCEMCGTKEEVKLVKPRYWIFNVCPKCNDNIKKQILK
jgi:hypothetical protein